MQTWERGLLICYVIIVVEVDIGGVNHKVECSTEIGADISNVFNKSLSTVY